MALRRVSHGGEDRIGRLGGLGLDLEHLAGAGIEDHEAPTRLADARERVVEVHASRPGAAPTRAALRSGRMYSHRPAARITAEKAAQIAPHIQ